MTLPRRMSPARRTQLVIATVTLVVIGATGLLLDLTGRMSTLQQLDRTALVVGAAAIAVGAIALVAAGAGTRRSRAAAGGSLLVVAGAAAVGAGVMNELACVYAHSLLPASARISVDSDHDHDAEADEAPVLRLFTPAAVHAAEHAPVAQRDGRRRGRQPQGQGQEHRGKHREGRPDKPGGHDRISHERQLTDDPQRARTNLAAIRAATLQYRAIDAAQADGYVLDPEKTERARSRARAGFVHVGNKAYRRDGRILDPARPETLMYRVDGDTLTLVGVVFTAPASTDTASTGNDFGLGSWHQHGSERSYMQHVWLTTGDDVRAAFSDGTRPANLATWTAPSTQVTRGAEPA